MPGAAAEEGRLMCDRDYYVTVCASCLTAACWHGEVMCDASHDAGSTKKLASELRRLNREHSGHYSPEKLTQVCGPILWVDGSAPSRNQQVDAAVQERIERAIYEAVAAERQRCAEKCQAIMRRHMEAESRKRTVEERSAEIAQALGAAECRGALSPYVVRDMSDEIARYPTFAEALVRYLDLREVIRSRANIVNEDECDGATDGNPDGLTEDERGQL